MLNPFKTNESSHSSQLDQSIFVLRFTGWYISFIQILIEHSEGNRGDPDQTPHFAASDLGLHRLPMSHKKDARLIWCKRTVSVRNGKSCFFKHSQQRVSKENSSYTYL